MRNWNSHLRDHHSVDGKTRKTLKHKYSDLNLQNPRNVRLPPPLEPPFSVLAEEECGYISISRPVIAQHCNTAHDWHSSKDDKEP
jgi:hypothetical protein